MVQHPIHVTRDGYRGNDPRKKRKAADKNRIALELERCINDKLLEQKEPVHSYMYYEIASATGVDVDLVRDLCFAIDGGSNGFTAIRHDLTYQQAMDACITGKPDPLGRDQGGNVDVPVRS